MAYFQLFRDDYAELTTVPGIPNLQLATDLAAARLSAMAASEGSGTAYTVDYESKDNSTGLGGYLHCRPFPFFAVVGDTSHYDIDGSLFECPHCSDNDGSLECNGCNNCEDCCTCNSWFCEGCDDYVSDSTSSCSNCAQCESCCSCLYCNGCDESRYADDWCSGCNRCEDCCECEHCDNCGDSIVSVDSKCEDGYGPCCCDEDCSHYESPEDD